MSRPPEVDRVIRDCSDAYVVGPEGYAWRGAARRLAEEVQRLEKANAELVAETHRWSAADKEATRQRDEQRRELLARAEAAEARVKELEEQLKGTMQAGGYEHFTARVRNANQQAHNAIHVAQQLEKKIAELEAQIAEVVGSQRNEDKSLPTWAQVMNRVALLTEQNARLRAAGEALFKEYGGYEGYTSESKTWKALKSALSGEEAST